MHWHKKSGITRSLRWGEKGIRLHLDNRYQPIVAFANVVVVVCFTPDGMDVSMCDAMTIATRCCHLQRVAVIVDECLYASQQSICPYDRYSCNMSNRNSFSLLNSAKHLWRMKACVCISPRWDQNCRELQSTPGFKSIRMVTKSNQGARWRLSFDTNKNFWRLPHIHLRHLGRKSRYSRHLSKSLWILIEPAVRRWRCIYTLATMPMHSSTSQQTMVGRCCNMWVTVLNFNASPEFCMWVFVIALTSINSLKKTCRLARCCICSH